MAELKFSTAFKYPFNRAKGLTNIFWILVPIIGWLALIGYTIRIVKEFCKGKFKKLPKFSFKSDLKLGFFMFIKFIPFYLAYGLLMVILSLIHPGLQTGVDVFLQIFVLPILFINFFNKETVQSLFEFKIVKLVFENLSDYVLAFLKTIALSVVFFVMWIVLVGIPAGSFTQGIFLSDFYRKVTKGRK